MSWNLLENLLGSWSFRPQHASRRKHSQSLEDASCLIRIESLEARQVPTALTIQIDYSYDTNQFFDTQAKKDLLQSVADMYSARITDDLLAINPSGNNTWNALFTNPATGTQTSVHNLVVPTDTIVLYAGGRDLSQGTLGVGGPGGYSGVPNSFFTTVDQRGQAGAAGSHPTDFGPWGGSITFDTVGTDWYFGTTPPDPSSPQYDFMSVAMHEIGHVLGFGTSDSFHTFVSNGTFTGPKADAEFGGKPQLASDRSHWVDGLKDGNQETSMDPSIAAGTRKLFTALDWAALDDIGWQTTPITVPIVTLPGATSTYTRGGPAVAVDPTATFANPDSLSLSGAKLTLGLTMNAGSYDFLSIQTGNGITKSGANIKYNGVTIGTYSNGSRSTQFTLKFNSKATDAAVQACLENLAFSTTSKKAGTLNRTVSIALTNIEGVNTVAATKVVKVA
ncbi:MAG: Calx-beta protein [Planctomycetaceae bacterium]|nr:Calx-beta protein [Planctomycetaceae bacterium]